jgi:hypothetical protein
MSGPESEASSAFASEGRRPRACPRSVGIVWLHKSFKVQCFQGGIVSEENQVFRRMLKR